MMGTVRKIRSRRGNLLSELKGGCAALFSYAYIQTVVLQGDLVYRFTVDMLLLVVACKLSMILGWLAGSDLVKMDGSPSLTPMPPFS